MAPPRLPVLRMTGVDRARRTFLIVLGFVMVLAGASTVLLGATSISGIDDPSPAVDSEMRFYAAWYVALGFLLVRAAWRHEIGGSIAKIVAATFFIAGCSRALSWAVIGKPPTIAVALMFVELLLPLLILPLRKSPTSEVSKKD